MFERQFGPLGPERGDFHAAQVAFYLVRTMGGKRSKKVKFPDVFLDWCPEYGHEMRLAARLADPDDGDTEDSELDDED